jgi:uncharacterized protein (DUF2342 family)
MLPLGSLMACAVPPPGFTLRRMAKPLDQSMSLLTALASAAATAYALAYVAHAEWGISRVRIREDALALAAVLGITMMVKIVLKRRGNGS